MTDPTIAQMREYFEYKSQEMFYVQVKKNCIKHLRDMNIATTRIAEIVFGETKQSPNVNHHLKHSKRDEYAEQCCVDWMEWIVNKQYPVNGHRIKGKHQLLLCTLIDQ